MRRSESLGLLRVVQLLRRNDGFGLDVAVSIVADFTPGEFTQRMAREEGALNGSEFYFDVNGPSPLRELEREKEFVIAKPAIRGPQVVLGLSEFAFLMRM